MPVGFAKKHCPDCLTDQPSSRREYLKLLRKCLVAVATTGLHRSIGWKFAEYMAASRCVVTEPLHCALPVPLLEGTHYLSFRSAEQCIGACERFLDDPGYAQSVRCECFAYYLNAVQPASIVRRCLNEALAMEAAGIEPAASSFE
jgi:hypothetical protein